MKDFIKCSFVYILFVIIFYYFVYLTCVCCTLHRSVDRLELILKNERTKDIAFIDN